MKKDNNGWTPRRVEDVEPVEELKHFYKVWNVDKPWTGANRCRCSTMKHTQDTLLSPLTESPWDILKRLYAREISAGIVSDWDGGITVWIEHPNLTQAIFTAEEFDKVAEWMQFEERRLFPTT